MILSDTRSPCYCSAKIKLSIARKLLIDFFSGLRAWRVDGCTFLLKVFLWRTASQTPAQGQQERLQKQLRSLLESNMPDTCQRPITFRRLVRNTREKAPSSGKHENKDAGSLDLSTTKQLAPKELRRSASCRTPGRRLYSPDRKEPGKGPLAPHAHGWDKAGPHSPK